MIDASHAAHPDARPLSSIAADAIRSGARFYLPEARNVPEDRLIDADALGFYLRHSGYFEGVGAESIVPDRPLKNPSSMPNQVPNKSEIIKAEM